MPTNSIFFAATTDRNHPNTLGFTARQRVHVIRIHHGATTMSNQFKKAVIDDVTARNINANLQDHLAVSRSASR